MAVDSGEEKSVGPLTESRMSAMSSAILHATAEGCILETTFKYYGLRIERHLDVTKHRDLDHSQDM